MTTPPAISPVLDIALDRLIADASGFRSREPRDRPVLVRFTEAELDLLTRIAADKGITRIDALRRLLALGIGQEENANRLAVAAHRLVSVIRGRRMVREIGEDAIRVVDEAILALRPKATTTRKRGKRRGALSRRLVGVAITTVLGLAGCGYSPAELDAAPTAASSGPGWTLEHDPNGRGYWAGPAGGRQQFYPSSHSYPVTPYPKGPRP